MTNQPLPEKADVIRLLLKLEGRVMVCLDATQKGVDVPRRFCHDAGLMLVLNRTMPQPIDLLPDAVASELRFGGIPHYCILPYAAIWSIFNPDTNHGMVWPDDMPDHVYETYLPLPLTLDGILPEQEQYAQMGFEAEAAHQPPPSPPRPAIKGVPVLTVIDGGQSTASSEHPIPSSTTKTRKPILRLVE